MKSFEQKRHGRQGLRPNNEANNQKPDRKAAWRKTVDLILPDSLMIFLAVLLVPIVILRLVIDLSTGWDLFLTYADSTILAIFILEYVSKALLAKNILKHVLDPWHILDLVVVLIPLADLAGILGGLGRSSPLLRLIRIVRVVAVGGRAVDRRIKQRSITTSREVVRPKLEIQVVDKDLGKVQTGVTLDGVKEYLSNESNSWIDICWASEDTLAEISKALDVPQIILESGLIDEAYPRVDYFDHFSTIFSRIADLNIEDKGIKRLTIRRVGLLVICRGRNIITISKTRTDAFDRILEIARKKHNGEDPLVISVLYAVIKNVLERDRTIIATMENELMRLENIPFKDRPPDFLEATFHLKKEVNQLVPSLLHMKEIAMVITSKRVPLEGFNENHEKLFDILADEAVYLHETAESARDSLLSLIDLYINTTSFELNKVMRIIAVITCLGIIPALCGMLGSNIIGNPWDIELWQLFSIIGFLMLAMGWVFYRMGWLKG
jgi:Mg2+ and Co2+ transporter CorA